VTDSYRRPISKCKTCSLMTAVSGLTCALNPLDHVVRFPQRKFLLARNPLRNPILSGQTTSSEAPSEPRLVAMAAEMI
jgi:hypothetical protein